MKHYPLYSEFLTERYLQGNDATTYAKKLGLNVKGDTSNNQLIGGTEVGVSSKLLEILSNLSSEFPNIKFMLTAGNDAFHKSTGGSHTHGNAIDFTVSPNTKKNITKVNNRLRALVDTYYEELGFGFINEYTHPSSKATDGHFHIYIKKIDKYDLVKKDVISGSGYSDNVMKSMGGLSLSNVLVKLENWVDSQSWQDTIKQMRTSIVGKTININDGRQVMAVQKALNSLGNNLKEDGWFGPETRSAIIKFQNDNNLKEDGIVGEQTVKTLYIKTYRKSDSSFLNRIQNLFSNK